MTSAGVPNLVQGCLPGVTLPESNRWHVNTSINTHIVYQKMLHRKLVETRSVGEPDLVGNSYSSSGVELQVIAVVAGGLALVIAVVAGGLALVIGVAAG